jgi:hypothetical protein
MADLISYSNDNDLGPLGVYTDHLFYAILYIELFFDSQRHCIDLHPESARYNCAALSKVSVELEFLAAIFRHFR